MTSFESWLKDNVLNPRCKKIKEQLHVPVVDVPPEPKAADPAASRARRSALARRALAASAKTSGDAVVDVSCDMLHRALLRVHGTKPVNWNDFAKALIKDLGTPVMYSCSGLVQAKAQDVALKRLGRKVNAVALNTAVESGCSLTAKTLPQALIEAIDGNPKTMVTAEEWGEALGSAVFEAVVVVVEGYLKVYWIQAALDVLCTTGKALRNGIQVNVFAPACGLLEAYGVLRKGAKKAVVGEFGRLSARISGKIRWPWEDKFTIESVRDVESATVETAKTVEGATVEPAIWAALDGSGLKPKHVGDGRTIQRLFAQQPGEAFELTTIATADPVENEDDPPRDRGGSEHAQVGDTLSVRPTDWRPPKGWEPTLASGRDFAWSWQRCGTPRDFSSPWWKAARIRITVSSLAGPLLWAATKKLLEAGYEVCKDVTAQASGADNQNYTVGDKDVGGAVRAYKFYEVEVNAENGNVGDFNQQTRRELAHHEFDEGPVPEGSLVRVLVATPFTKKIAVAAICKAGEHDHSYVYNINYLSRHHSGGTATLLGESLIPGHGHNDPTGVLPKNRKGKYNKTCHSHKVKPPCKTAGEEVSYMVIQTTGDFVPVLGPHTVKNKGCPDDPPPAPTITSVHTRKVPAPLDTITVDDLTRNLGYLSSGHLSSLDMTSKPAKTIDQITVSWRGPSKAVSGYQIRVRQLYRLGSSLKDRVGLDWGKAIPAVEPYEVNTGVRTYMLDLPPFKPPDIPNLYGTEIPTATLEGYKVDVRALYDEIEGAVASSEAVTPQAPPAAPAGLAAVTGDASVTLTWDAPSGVTLPGYSVTGYEFRRRVDLDAVEWDDDEHPWVDVALKDDVNSHYVALLGGEPRSFTVTTVTETVMLDNGVSYLFQVRAVNGAGPGAAAEIAAVPGRPPPAPRNLTAATGDASVTLSWDPPAAPAADAAAAAATGYQYRGRVDIDGNDWDDTLPAHAWALMVQGGKPVVFESGERRSVTVSTVAGDVPLDNGVAYEFQVRAVNATTSRSDPAEVAAVPNKPPPAPQGLTAAAGDASVTLTWDAPDTGADDEVEVTGWQYRLRAGSAWDDARPAHAWQLMTVYETGDDMGEGEPAAAAPLVFAEGAEPSYVVTAAANGRPLTNAAPYVFQVRAINGTSPGPAAESPAVRPCPAGRHAHAAGASDGDGGTHGGDGDGCHPHAVPPDPLLCELEAVTYKQIDGGGHADADVPACRRDTAPGGRGRAFVGAAGAEAPETAEQIKQFAPVSGQQIRAGFTQGYKELLAAAHLRRRLGQPPWVAPGWVSATGWRGDWHWQACVSEVYDTGAPEGDDAEASRLVCEPRSADTAGSWLYTPVQADAGKQLRAYVYYLHNTDGGARWAAVTALTAAVSPGAPAAPAGLGAEGGVGSVDLTWDDPGDPTITSHKIRWKPSEIRGGQRVDKFTEWLEVRGGAGGVSAPPGGKRGYTQTLLENGVEYTFEVLAVNAVGDGAASEASAATCEAGEHRDGGTAGCHPHPPLCQLEASTYTPIDGRGHADAQPVDACLRDTYGQGLSRVKLTGASPPAEGRQISVGFDPWTYRDEIKNARRAANGGSSAGWKSSWHWQACAYDADDGGDDGELVCEPRTRDPENSYKYTPTAADAGKHIRAYVFYNRPAGGARVVAVAASPPLPAAAAPDAPTGFTAAGGDPRFGNGDKVKLRWDVPAAGDALYYEHQIRRQNPGGGWPAWPADWTGIGSVADGDFGLLSDTRKATFRITGLSPGAAYQVRLRARHGPDAEPPGAAADPSAVARTAPLCLLAVQTYQAGENTSYEVPACPRDKAIAFTAGVPPVAGRQITAGFEDGFEPGAAAERVSGLVGGLTRALLGSGLAGRVAGALVGQAAASALSDWQWRACEQQQQYEEEGGELVASTPVLVCGPAAGAGTGYRFTPALADAGKRIRAHVYYTHPTLGTRHAAVAVTAEAVLAGKPAPPRNLGAAGGDGSVTLTWDDPGDASITSHNIHWKPSDASGPNSGSKVDAYTSWSTIPAGGVSAPAAGKLSYTQTLLENGTLYTFQILAANAAGAGLPSNEASATPRAACPTGEHRDAGGSGGCHAHTVPACHSGAGAGGWYQTSGTGARTNSGGHPEARVARCAQIRSFTATPLSEGSGTTLAWTTEHAARVELGAETRRDVDGSKVVNPNAMTSYTLKACNADGHCSAPRTLKVQAANPPDACEEDSSCGADPPAAPELIDHFRARPAVVTAGSEVVLDWRTSNAASVTLNTSWPVASAGSMRFTPDRTADHTLTACNADGECATERVEVRVVQPRPVISSFEADSDSITSGSGTTLRWTATNAASFTLAKSPFTCGPGGTDPCVAAETVTGASRQVAPTATTTYRLRACNADNQCVSRSLNVTVTAPVPVIDSFAAAPAAVTEGSSTVLSWATTGATAVTINNRPSSPDGSWKFRPDDAWSFTPGETTDYTLSACAGDVCADPRTLSVAVTGLAAPAGLAFADRGSDRVTLTWDAPPAGQAGQFSYQIRYKRDLPSGYSWPDWSDDTVLAAGAGTLAPHAGATAATITGLNSSWQYKAEVRAVNGVAQGPAARLDEIPPYTVPPVIDSFEADPVSVTRRQSTGETLTTTLSWATTGAVSVTLKAGSADAKAVALDDSETVTPDRAAPATVYTLKACNALKKECVTETVTVTVSVQVPCASGLHRHETRLDPKSSAVDDKNAAIADHPDVSGCHAHTAPRCLTERSQTYYTIGSFGKHNRASLEACARVAGFEAAGADGRIQLTWTSPRYADQVSRYEYRIKPAAQQWDDDDDAHAWQYVSGSVTQTRVTGLPPNGVALTNGVEYTVELRSVNPSGHPGASESRTATPTAALTPTGFEAEGGDGYIQLTWNRVLIPEQAQKYQYRIKPAARQWDDDDDAHAWTTTSGGTETKASKRVERLADGARLSNGTEYTVELRAVKVPDRGPDRPGVAAGPATATPKAPTPATPPGGGTGTTTTTPPATTTTTTTLPVGGLGAIGSSYSSISVRWPSSVGAQRYQVSYRAYKPGVYEDAHFQDKNVYSGLSTTISGLRPGTRYQIRVTAWPGRIRYRTTTATTLAAPPADAPPAAGAPAAPEGLRASVTGGVVRGGSRHTTSVTLEWDDAPGVLGYAYRYIRSGGDLLMQGASWVVFDPPSGAGNPRITKAVGGLTLGSTFKFQLRARNSAGWGTITKEVPVKTDKPDAPGAVTGLKNHGSTYKKIALVWDDPGDPTVRYESRSALLPTWGTFSWSDDHGWTKIAVSKAGGKIAMTLDKDTRPVSVGRSSWLISNFLLGRTYGFQVRAYRQCEYCQGGGVPGEEAAVYLSPLDEPRPNAPSGLEATPGDGTVTLRWSEPHNPANPRYTPDTRRRYCVLITWHGDPPVANRAMCGEGEVRGTSRAKALTLDRALWGHRGNLGAGGHRWGGYGYSNSHRLENDTEYRFSVWAETYSKGQTGPHSGDYIAGDSSSVSATPTATPPTTTTTAPTTTTTAPTTSTTVPPSSVCGPGEHQHPGERQHGAGVCHPHAVEGDCHYDNVTGYYARQGISGTGHSTVRVGPCPAPEKPAGLTAVYENAHGETSTARRLRPCSSGRISLLWQDPGDPSITHYQYRIKDSGSAWGGQNQFWRQLSGSDATGGIAVTGRTAAGARAVCRPLDVQMRFVRSNNGVVNARNGRSEAAEAVYTPPLPACDDRGEHRHIGDGGAGGHKDIRDGACHAHPVPEKCHYDRAAAGEQKFYTAMSGAAHASVWKPACAAPAAPVGLTASHTLPPGTTGCPSTRIELDWQSPASGWADEADVRFEYRLMVKKDDYDSRVRWAQGQGYGDWMRLGYFASVGLSKSCVAARFEVRAVNAAGVAGSAASAYYWPPVMPICRAHAHRHVHPVPGDCHPHRPPARGCHTYYGIQYRRSYTLIADNLSGHRTVYANRCPAAPGGVRAAGGVGVVELSWDDPGSRSVRGWQYRIRSRGSSEDAWGGWGSWRDVTGAAPEAGRRSHAIGGLAAWRTYQVRVRAFTDHWRGRGRTYVWPAYGSGSAAVSAVVSSAEPPVPGGFTAVGGVRDIVLGWDAFVHPAGAGYEVTGYEYQLRDPARPDWRPGWREVPVIPGAPVGLSAVGGDGSVVLSWEVPADESVTGHEVRWRARGGGADWGEWRAVAVAAAPGGGFGHTQGGLANGVEHQFEVRAVNASGAGAATAPASATPRGGAAAGACPAGEHRDGGTGVCHAHTVPECGIDAGSYTAVDGEGHAAAVGVAACPREAGRVLLYDPAASGSAVAPAAGRQIHAGFAGGYRTAIQEAHKNRGGGGFWRSAWHWQACEPALGGAEPVCGPAAPGGYKYTPTGADAGKQIRAVVYYNHPVTGTRTAAATALSAAVAPAAAPAAAAAAVLPTGFTLTPEDPARVEDAFTARPGAAYVVKLRARNAHGASPAAEASATPRHPPIPAAPSGLAAVGGDRSITLTWDAPEAPVVTDYYDTTITGYSYRVMRYGSGTRWSHWRSGVIPADATSFTLTPGNTGHPLVNGKSYYVELRAYNAYSEAAWQRAYLKYSRQRSHADYYARPASRSNYVMLLPAPAGLAAAAGEGSVTLSWDAWADPGDPSVTRYEYRMRRAGESWPRVWFSGSGGGSEPAGERRWRSFGSGCGADATSCDVGGLANGVEHHFQVRAVRFTGMGWNHGAGRNVRNYGYSAASVEVSAVPECGSGRHRDGAAGDCHGHAPVCGLLAGSYTPIDGEGHAEPVSVAACAREAGRTALRGAGAPVVGGEVSVVFTGGYAATVENAHENRNGGDADGWRSGWLWQACEPAAGQPGALVCEPRTPAGGGDGGSYAPTAADAGKRLRAVVFYPHPVTGARTAAVTALSGAVAAAAPAAPGGLTAVGGDASAVLAWDDPGDAAVTGHEIRWKTDGGYNDWRAVIPAAAAGGGLGHTLRGLENGVAHTFQVRAVNGAGAGEASGEASATPEEAEPGEACPAGEHRDGGAGDCHAHPVPACLILPGSHTPIDGDGHAEAVSVAACPREAGRTLLYDPAPPGGGASAVAGRQIAAGFAGGYAAEIRNAQMNRNGGASAGWRSGWRWQACEPAAGRPGAGVCEPRSRDAAGSFLYTPTAADAGKRIRAVVYYPHPVTGARTAAATALTRAVAAAPPAAPGGLTAAGGDASAVLAWDDPADASVTGHEIRWKTTGGYNDWRAAAAVAAPGGGLAHTQTGLANGAAHTFQVRAVNAAGAGGASEEATATPEEAQPGEACPAGEHRDGGAGDCHAHPVPACRLLPGSHTPIDGDGHAAPQTTPACPREAAGKAELTGAGAPAVGRQFHAGFASGYRNAIKEAHQNRGGAGYWRSSWHWQTCQPAALVCGPAVRGGYKYTPTAADAGKRIRAHVYYNHPDTGTRVVAVTAPSAPVLPAAAPAAPAGLAAAARPGAAALTWNDPAHAAVTGHEIRWKTTGAYNQWQTIAPAAAAAPGGGRSHTQTGLDNNTTHTFQVRAVNARGPGQASNEATATTPEPAPPAPPPCPAGEHRDAGTGNCHAHPAPAQCGLQAVTHTPIHGNAHADPRTTPACPQDTDPQGNSRAELAGAADTPAPGRAIHAGFATGYATTIKTAVAARGGPGRHASWVSGHLGWRSSWHWQTCQPAQPGTAPVCGPPIRGGYKYTPTQADTGKQIRAHVYYIHPTTGNRTIAITAPTPPVTTQ